MMKSMSEPSDGMDASLRNFGDPISPNLLSRPCSTLPSSEPATDHDPYEDEEEDSDIASVAGGYSPPAWRRLGNGDRSSGFWKGPHDDMLSTIPPLLGDPESDYEDEESEVLDRAIRTRLPRGSQSPGKGRSPSPQPVDDRTLRVHVPEPITEVKTLPLTSYVRFDMHAELQNGLEPIIALYKQLQQYYRSATATWASTFCSIIVGLAAIGMFRLLLEPASRRPAGDLVKVAGVARSFEPLIYYSESAVLQVHELQATSVAVWDLSESVRSSDMRDAGSIVSDLDALSDTMKTLSIEMTKFFSRVDGDIDGILNVMDWAKMHLKRFQSTSTPSTISSTYDRVHGLLSSAHIFENSAGETTAIGTMATYIFGMSQPQREQRLVQLLFNEFLTVLEDSIQAELQHSVTLFALFEAVDRHFLNLARTVVRETSTQEELHADMLSGLWVRILGARADELRKFEQNRKLLHNVREKTVLNKHTLVTHQSKLLALRTSLESLRGKLVSPLVRGSNATQLTLDDQIYGLSSVSEYLGELRSKQKGKVMETLFASVPSKKLMIEEGQPIYIDSP